MHLFSLSSSSSFVVVPSPLFHLRAKPYVLHISDVRKLLTYHERRQEQQHDASVCKNCPGCCCCSFALWTTKEKKRKVFFLLGVNLRAQSNPAASASALALNGWRRRRDCCHQSWKKRVERKMRKKSKNNIITVECALLDGGGWGKSCLHFMLHVAISGCYAASSSLFLYAHE